MPEQQNPEHQLEYLTELRRKYEEALSNAQKTQDYSEAEKLKEELETRLTDLEAQFIKPEPVITSFEKVEKGETTYERAKEIMGKDFFGVEAIKKAFDMNVGLGNNKVPYSEAELRRVSERGEEMLVYRLSIGLSMEQIVNRVKLSEDEGVLLLDAGWYKKEDFFQNQDPRSGWALVSKDVIPDSTGLNYIQQTRVLREHLIKLDSISEDELQEVTDKKLHNIVILMQTDLVAASKQLSNLKINQNHRRTAVEALYDFVIRFKNTPDAERMLENIYDLTNSLASNGDLVRFGFAKADGAGVYKVGPGTPGSKMGMVSVR